MKRGVVETVAGALVLLVAAGFAIFAYWRVDGGELAGAYPLTARFGVIDGLTPAADVRLSGVRIGRVSDWHIDPQSYRAVVEMNIAGNVSLPADSVVEIVSGGLLGGKYIRVVPGNEKTFLQPGGMFTQSKDPVALEDLIGRAIFMIADKPR